MPLLKEEIEIGVQEAELATQKALAEFPPFLRWLVILVAIAVIPAYFIAKNVSHGIWQNRYSQAALKAKSSFTNPGAPKVSSVYLTTLQQNNYAAAIQITNPNLDLSLSSATFQFLFYNSQKQQVYSYSDQLYLLPNETKYIVVPTFQSSDKISYANFKLPSALNWQKKISFPHVNLTASTPNAYTQTNPLAFVLEGNISNNSPYLLKKVLLTFILFDQNSNIVGLSTRNESTLNPFERRSYKQLWPNLLSDNINSAKVFVSSNPLDPDNLTLPDYNTNSSDLSRPQKTR